MDVIRYIEIFITVKGYKKGLGFKSPAGFPRLLPSDCLMKSTKYLAPCLTAGVKFLRAFFTIYHLMRLCQSIAIKEG